jgi:hypothetical protein
VNGLIGPGVSLNKRTQAVSDNVRLMNDVMSRHVINNNIMYVTMEIDDVIVLL